MSAPLVLLHGAGLDHRVWDPWLALLAPHAVLALSLPGRLDVPGPPCATVAEAAQYVARTLAERGVERFVVAGHSYGSAIALELALTQSERVAGLALLSSGARLRVHPAILDALRAGHAPPGTTTTIDTALVDWLSVSAFDHLGEALAVRAPTLVIAGADDVLTPPKYARYLVDAITGARLVLVPDAGHNVPMEQPAACVAAVRTLL